jgi:alpha-ketoglutaric semialdehyde dehydrogenase
MITHNIIGFQLSATSGKHIYAADPGTLTTLPEAFATATAAETDKAVRKAYEAFNIFKKISGTHRAEFLQEIAKGIEDLGQVLVERIMQETAYPEARVIVERNRTCAQLRMFATEAISGGWKTVTIDPALPDRTPAPRPEIRKIMMPLGPVVVFGASNFPLAYSTAGGDVASAFAVGCPVIVKAHDSHLGTNALVAEVILEAARKTGMPDGVFSSLNGDGMHTGQQLVLHPMTAAVGFTGSRQGGRALFDLGQQRENPIPVFAEMGSVNPIFIFPGKIRSDIKGLTGQIVSSMTMTVGQFCTNPGLLIALKDFDTKTLINELASALSIIPEASMLNPGIYKSFQRGVAAIREVNGVVMIQDQPSTGGLRTTPVLATVPADVFLSHPHLHHEVFGPFSIMVLCENMDEMLSVASALEGQLTATVQADDDELPQTLPLIDMLIQKAGRIIMNGVPTGVEVCAAMTHGGPYPASTDSRFTAVGHHAMQRWLRPVSFQNFPERLISGMNS